jgi:hypothetical protein
MEGTFNITNSKLNSQYEFKAPSIIVNGTFTKDATTGDLLTLNGACYRNENGEVGAYFGTFTGTPSGGEIQYDLSSMRRQDSNLVWDAIDAIEPQILGNGTNAGEE